MINRFSYRIVLGLFTFVLSHAMVLAGNVLEPIDAQPVWNFCKVDSASATLSYVMGSSSNNNNKIKIHLGENQRLTLYCRNFTYNPGVNGKKLNSNDYELMLNLVQENKGNVEYPYSYNIPFSFKQTGDAVICNNKCTIDLMEGDYTISYLGFLGFVKKPEEPIHFFSLPAVTTSTMSTIVITCSAGDIKEDTTSFTPEYPSVPSADVSPCISHTNICFKGGGKTEYTYSATGEKLQVKHTPSIGDKAIITNYCGEAVFDDIKLETVQFDGGYMSYKHTSSPVFYHYVKDYQGSNRVIYNSQKNEIIQRISYYPFGSILNTDQDADFQRYFYNGKELESLQGLFLYDYGARFYDGIRFTTMDPLAEKYYSISPYAYCGNNPINAIDPNGAYIYLLFYSAGNARINSGGDEEFMSAAYTRKYDIEHSKGFDKNKDIVLVLPFDDITKLSQIVEYNITEYSAKYGKTKEVGFWSHAGFDGPIGTINAIGAEDVIEGKQLSISGWGKINFNWDPKGSIGFYGCNTGRGEGNSFAQKISRGANMKNINVYGQPDYTAFSGSSTQATYYSEKLTNGSENFKRTYLVTPEIRKMYWWLNSSLKRMKWYYNGKTIR